MSAPNMGLTSEQISHFNTFGFIVLKQVFGNAELVAIRGEFDL